MTDQPEAVSSPVTAPKPREHALVYMAYGEKFVRAAVASATESRLPDIPIYLLTDQTTPLGDLPDNIQPVRTEFEFGGKLAKVELMRSLPENLDIVLFLDVDTRVLGDISLGFEKAEQHGIAMAPAPHYSLEDFRSFGSVMDREGVPRNGQMLYNSGVIFFDVKHEKVQQVFATACEVAAKDEIAPWGDQTYITLAMEMLGFNPYTLSASFNHRAFGELISGQLRIWHSYAPVPKGAAELKRGYLHRYQSGKMMPVLRVPE